MLDMVPQIQTVEKIVEVPQVQMFEKVVPVPQVQVQEIVTQVLIPLQFVDTQLGFTDDSKVSGFLFPLIWSMAVPEIAKDDKG